MLKIRVFYTLVIIGVLSILVLLNYLIFSWLSPKTTNEKLFR